MEMTTQKQIEFLQALIDKATQNGAFNLQEAFSAGQVLNEVVKLPQEIEELKKHNAELMSKDAINEATKKMPVTKN